jgi:signal recognition particle subunit SRP54
MLPGMPGMSYKLDIEESQKRLGIYRIIMDSMTDEEMEDPRLIKSSRVLRIAKGAGVDPKEVRSLLHQYNDSKKAVKGLMGNRKLRRQLMKQFESGEMGLKP